MDNKNNLDLINIEYQSPGNIRDYLDFSGHARKGHYIHNNPDNRYNNNKMKFSTEEDKFLVHSNSPDEYKNICAGNNGNYVFSMNYDSTARNFSHCKWSYDKEKLVIKNERFPNYCLGPWNSKGWWSLRGCDDGNIVRWLWEDDWEKCKQLGLGMNECRLSKINEAEKQCNKYTGKKICNTKEIDTVKNECNLLGISDDICNNSTISSVKNYFSENITEKPSYNLMKNCQNSGIQSKECSQNLIDKCKTYLFNSPGNVKNCNKVTVESHEKSCKDAGLDLAICTVDELTNQLNRKIISEGQNISQQIAIQSLEQSSKNQKQFLNDVNTILNGGNIKDSVDNTIRKSVFLDQQTFILLGATGIILYLLLSDTN